MVRVKLSLAEAVLMSLFLVGVARGAFTNYSSSAQASAQAFAGSASNFSNPPANTFSPPATGVGCNANTSATDAGASASTSINVSMQCVSSIHVFGVGSENSGGQGATAGSNANGTIAFTETATETQFASLGLSDTTHGGFSVTIKNSANTTILSMANTLNGKASAVFAPDTYTLTWSASVGRAGGTNPQFPVQYDFAMTPEPSGLAVTLVGGLILPLRRRRTT